MAGFRPNIRSKDDAGAKGISPLMTGGTLLVGEAVVELHSKSAEACVSFFFIFIFIFIFMESAESADSPAETCISD
jgi:hypothetical protein